MIPDVTPNQASCQDDCNQPSGCGGVKAFNVKIGLPSAVMFLTGSIIGTGIFLTPNSIANAVPSVLYSIVIWIVCAILAVFASLCYSELAIIFPKCGGEYNYFEKAYHPCFAFSFLFTNFLLIKPAVIALFMIFFVENLLITFYPDASSLPYWGTRLFACLVLFALCVLNCWSMKVTLQLSNILTYCKLCCILIMIGIGLYNLGKGNFVHLQNAYAPIEVTPSKISLAIYAGMFSYDNWNCIAYIAEDMYKPRRNILRSIMITLLVVTCCYVLTYFSYVIVVGIDGIRGSSSVAIDTAQPYLGPATPLIGVLVSLSALGAGSATYVCGCRVIFEGARNGHFPEIICSVHPKTNTMIVSYVIQCILSVFYILFSPNIEKLLIYFSNGSWVFYGAAMLSVIVIRYRLKIENQTFKVPLVLAGFMTCVSIALVVLSFMDDAIGTGISVGIIVICIPFYYLFVHNGGFIPKVVKNKFNASCDTICQTFGLVIPQSDLGFE